MTNDTPESNSARNAPLDLTAVRSRARRLAPDTLRGALTHLLLVGLLLVIFLPILLAFVMSTQSVGEVFDVNYLLPGSSAFENYHAVLVEWDFARLLLNTLVMAAAITVISIGTALLAALGLVFYDFPGERIVFLGILFTLLFPIPVRVVPLYQLMAEIGWQDTIYGLTLPFLASATSVFLLRQRFRSIAAGYVETAKMRGVGPLTFLWKVLIPMSRGMLVGLVAIIFIAVWNYYLWPLVVIDTYEMNVVQVGVRFLQGAEAQGITQWNLIMSGSIIALLPPLLLLIVLRRPLLQTLGVD